MRVFIGPPVSTAQAPASPPALLPAATIVERRSRPNLPPRVESNRPLAVAAEDVRMASPFNDSPPAPGSELIRQAPAQTRRVAESDGLSDANDMMVTPPRTSPQPQFPLTPAEIDLALYDITPDADTVVNDPTYNFLALGIVVNTALKITICIECGEAIEPVSICTHTNQHDPITSLRIRLFRTCAIDTGSSNCAMFLTRRSRRTLSLGFPSSPTSSISVLNVTADMCRKGASAGTSLAVGAARSHSLGGCPTCHTGRRSPLAHTGGIFPSTRRACRATRRFQGNMRQSLQRQCRRLLISLIFPSRISRTTKTSGRFFIARDGLMSSRVTLLRISRRLPDYPTSKRNCGERDFKTRRCAL